MGPEFTHLLDSLGWAVLHSLWQGGLAFIVVVLLRTSLRNGSPALRYNAQMLVLLSCLGAFLATFALYAGATSPETLRASGAGGNDLTFGGLISTFNPSHEAAGFHWPDISAFTPLIALSWVIGFMALSLRYAFAYGQVQQLRVLGVSEAPLDWKLRFLTLMETSGIKKTVQLHVSQHIDGPMTMGFLKPVVLVPTGFLTGIPSDQVEAVLLHELAHIRRHDYLLNLVQTGVRTVLFYHPAIHIISRWIDRDREQACDDIAVSKGQDAGALLRGLAALRLQTGSLAMSATGKGEETPLMDRLSRLAGQGQATPRRPEHVLMSLLSALMIGTVYVGAMAQADAHPHPKKPKLSVEAPKPPSLSDTIISAKPYVAAIQPAPPPLPALPPTEFIGDVDEDVFQSFIETDKAIWKSYEIAMRQYEKSLESYLEKTSLTEDEMEDIVEHYEDYAEEIEELFEDRRESIEDQYENYIEDRTEANEDWTDALEEEIEYQVERAVNKAEQAISETIRRTQSENFQRAKEQREEAEKQREIAKSNAISAREANKLARKKSEDVRKEADKARKEALAHAKHDKKSRNKHEMFRDDIMKQLLKDGLIRSKSETVALSHPTDTLILNGKPLPKDLRGKYCDMWDRAGFKDGHTQVTITPESLTILADYKNGQHTTRVTYGTWED